MTKNSILNIGIILCKLFRLFFIIILLLLTFFFVLAQVSPSSYTDFSYSAVVTKTGVSFDKVSSHPAGVDDKVSEDSDAFNFMELSKGSLYFNFIKLGIVFLLLFFSIQEFQRVIESVKEIQTFQRRNVLSFRRIGTYILISTGFMSFSWFSFEHGGIGGIHISFEFLIFALLAFIMAEIFKEGNSLLEENKLTV